MADELDPVTQQFIADTAEYTADLDEASATAEEFAIANEEAKTALDGVRDSAAEAGAAVAGIGAGAAEAADAEGHLRDSALEAGEALGHVRDEALEASASVRELGDSADETAAKLDLMALSGVGTFTSLGPLVGIIGAAVVAAAAAAPAFIAMQASLGAFGLFAIPTLSAVSAGYQAVTKDQQAYDSATTAAAKSTALAKLKNDWAQMPAPIAQVVKEVISFKNEFTSLAKSSGIQSSVLSDITQGLQMARQLLPEIVPLAQAGARSVSMILTTLSTALQSSGFRQFIQLMTSMSGVATQAIMRLAGALSGTLGQAIEALMGNSVPFINLVTMLVQALSGPLIAALNVVIGLFLSLASALEPLLPGLSQIATALIQDIGGSFAAFIPILMQVISLVGGSLIKILQDLEPVIANALTPNSPFMLALGQLPAVLAAIMPLITGFTSILANPAVAQAAVWVLSLVVAFRGLMGVAALLGTAFTWIIGLPAKIIALVTTSGLATGAARAWAAAQWLLNGAMDANPVALAIIAVAALIAVTVLVVTHLHAFANAFDEVRHTVASWGHDVAAAFDQVRHDIAAAVDAVINFLKANWKLILSILLDPIGTAVMEIKDHTHQIAQAFDAMRHDVAAVLAGARHDVASAFDDVRHSIAAFADWLPTEVKNAFVLAVKAQQTMLDDARHDVAAAFDDIRHSVAAGVGDVLAFFRKLPGQVTSFLAGLPGQMLAIGENVIKGLINGILNAAASIPSIMRGLASDVASYFTNPLKLFSPSRLFFEHGFNIVQGAINGVKANAPNLLATMRGLGAGVGATGSPLAAGAVAPAGGSTTVHVPVQVTAQGLTPDYQDPRFTQYIQGVVQEGVLRYGHLNPNNGLTPAWGR